MYFVYILRTSKNTLYIGQTNNLKERLLLHKNGKGAKYLRGFTDFQLIYTEEFNNRSDALKREYQLKQLGKKEKEELIHSKVRDLQLYFG